MFASVRTIFGLGLAIVTPGLCVACDLVCDFRKV